MPPATRTAREVIDQAIYENRAGESLCYVFAIVFVLVGVVVIVWGAAVSQGLVSLAGSIASILFWPAMREARQIRKENMAIRMLEVPLSMAGTGKAAAEALREAFTTVFVSGKG
jgi:hypothetical protein